MTTGVVVGERGFLEGRLLDQKYRIGRQLGEGGMGAVYRATHLGTMRTVAVKVIRPRFSTDQEFVERFRREAEAAGRLRHPNVVDVTDFGFAGTSAGRVAYLVMEYLDGCTLAEVLAEEGRLPPDWVVDIMGQACSAVDEAHRLGIVHRDLKPDNIWLEPNRRGGYTVKVLDFGLAKLGAPFGRGRDGRESVASASVTSNAATPPVFADGVSRFTESPTMARPLAAADAATPVGEPGNAAAAASDEDERDANELTRVGSLVGTPLYMSPEQCRGESLDARSDIYSLGVIAYRMLAGEAPFAGTVEELVRLHVTASPQPLIARARDTPRGLGRVVMAALAKDPAERPQSAAAFASALRANAEGSGALLRQALALYSERSPALLRISLVCYAPVIVAAACLYLIDGDPPWIRLSASMMRTIGPWLLVAMAATNFLAYAMVSAASIPIVIQSMVAPLRPLRLSLAFGALRRRWWTFSLATLAVMAMILGGMALLVVPGVAALLSHALYAPVVVMESGSVRATLRRARGLARRSRTTLLVITLLQFALPVVVWVASFNLSFQVDLGHGLSIRGFGFNFGASGKSALWQMLNVFVTPLAAVMTALLYLKARQAGGESLMDVVDRFDALEIPRSRWQARMRSSAVSGGGAQHVGRGWP